MLGYSRVLTPFRLMALGGLLPGVVAVLLFWHVRPGAVTLEWRFAKDQPFFEESIIESQNRTKIEGMRADMTDTVTFHFHWTPRTQDPIRNWIIDRRLRRVIIRRGATEDSVVWDSANPTTGPNPFAEAYKDSIGTKSTLTVGPHTPGVLIEMPRTGPLDLEADHGRELQRRLAEDVLLWTPPHPVRPGDTWEAEREIPMGWMGSFQARCRFTYLGLEEKLDKVNMEMDLEHRLPTTRAGAAGAGIRFKSGKLTVEPGAGGTAWFDRNRGRLNHAEMLMHVKGKITIEVQGANDGEIEYDTPTRTTIKIRDLPHEPN